METQHEQAHLMINTDPYHPTRPGFAHKSPASASAINSHNKPQGGHYDNGTVNEHRGHTWRSGFLDSFPHEGAWAFIGCLASIGAIIAVLVRCDGSPKSEWTIQPTVYVSALTAVTNLLARRVFHLGVRINWWRRAHTGGTIRELRNLWSQADSFFCSLAAGRYSGLISLASIAVTLIVVDQPLIQRAVTVVSVSKTALTNVTGIIAPEIPIGYTSIQVGRGDTQQLMLQPMITTLNDYNSQTPIQPKLEGCQGNCTGYIEAGGLATQCNTTTRNVYYLANESLSNLGMTSTPFSVAFEYPIYVPDQLAQIRLSIAYSQNSKGSDCSAVRTEVSCSLSPATLRYPINMVNGAITLGDALGSDSIVELQPIGSLSLDTEDTGDWSRYTLGGLWLAAVDLFQANATYTWAGGLGDYFLLSGTLSSQFLDVDASEQNSTNSSAPITLYDLTMIDPCTANWTDPTSYILNSLNNMAFRLSVLAANFEYRNSSATPSNRTWPMSEVRQINVYQVEYRYLFASVAITTSLACFVALSYNRWWDLGRHVTFNPIEMAKAFDAPLLRGPGSNAPLQELVRLYGSRKIQWGEVEYLEGSTDGTELKRKRLVFADAVDVIRPRKGTVYE